jgi:hypothetical protein
MIDCINFKGNNPRFNEVSYDLDQELGWYNKTPQKIPFLKLPARLKVEVTQTNTPKKNGAEIVIHGGKLKGKYLFYTGMCKTEIMNVYYGNDFEIRKEKKVLSLCIFYFNEDNTWLRVFYFTGYYIHNRELLESFVQQFIIGIDAKG